MKTLLFIAMLAVAGVIWALGRIERADLGMQVNTLRRENGELDALRSERARLQRLQPPADEQATLQRDAAERARLQREMRARDEAVHQNPPAALPVGEWVLPAAWKDRGHATPNAAVETALWAGAGGDLARLQAVLQLDDTVRAKADAILAGLPENLRQHYESAEHLIAAFTTKAIPLGEAQLVWQHQPGPDEAVACVFVRNPEATSAPRTPEGNLAPLAALKGPPQKVPPMAPAHPKTSCAILSLRRSEDGWRLVVPLSAVEKIAKELGGVK